MPCISQENQISNWQVTKKSAPRRIFNGKFPLTFLCPRGRSFSVSFITSAASIVGIAPCCSFTFITRLFAMLRMTEKHDYSKCMPHRIAWFPGIQLDLYRWTKRIHCIYLCASFSLSGKWWKKPPGVRWLFPQLSPFGPPATQRFPPSVFFGTLLTMVNVHYRCKLLCASWLKW